MDLNQVKSLFTATDFERGMEYYRKGRVTDMQCTKASPETNVSCTVRGSKRYTVRFTEMAEGLEGSGCLERVRGGNVRLLDIPRMRELSCQERTLIPWRDGEA